jgi:membrane protease YdiL (CAAX protease family)
MPGWTLFVPGASHFMEHRYLRGTAFAATEVGGITLGLLYDSKLQGTSSSPYYNFPLLMGLQAYNVDMCNVLHNWMSVTKYYHPEMKYDTMSFNQLLIAPFKPKNIFSPLTGGFILAAIAELWLDTHGARSINKVNQMYFMDRYIDRNPALAAYGAVSLATSYGAGVAEEYVFRNSLMPLWDWQYGQKKGLAYSSLFFGAAHLTNILFETKPDYRAALMQFVEASIAGWVLGNNVQKNNYQVGQAVAAHAWYDFTLMLGSFLLDPENNVFGVSVKFTI